MKATRLIDMWIVRVAILTALATAAAGAAAPNRPNIILILADDFGYECVTANGGESYRTPHLDRLAAGGMRFERCHVQPLCTPTRVQLLTGLYNVRNYVSFGAMDPQATTLAHLLKQAGYVTGVVGKWQLGREPGSPRHFGFDDAFLWNHTRSGVARYANPGLDRNGVEKTYANGEFGPALLNDHALEFVTRHRERPFFLFYSMLLTHPPFQPTPDSANWDRTATGEAVNRDVRHFADMTAYLDKMIGRLVAKLEELGLRENTLILFLGDNGTHSSVTSTFKGRPYTGGKGSSTARGTHVPLIASWPGRIAAGGVNRDLIASVDFLPTLCSAAEIALPAALPPDGRSFLPQLLGRAGQPREWFYSWHARDGGPRAQSEFAQSVGYKLYRDGRFFDLAADPFEERAPLALTGLSGRAAAAAEMLRGALDRYKDARPRHLGEPAAGLAPKAEATAGAASQRPSTVTFPQVSEEACPTEVIAVPGRDGHRVTAAIRKPPGRGPFPAVVILHGGLMERPTDYLKNQAVSSPMHARFLAAGYLTVTATFRSRDRDPQTREALTDCLDVIAHVKKLPHVSADSVVVMGGSGGGSLALELAGETDLAAIAAGEPASILFTGMMTSNDEASRPLMQKAMDDPKAHYTPALQAFTRAKIAKVRCPVLIVHGDRHAINKINHEIIIPELRAARKPLEVVAYPGQPHGFYFGATGEPAAGEKCFNDMHAFFQQHMRAQPVPLDESLLRRVGVAARSNREGAAQEGRAPIDR